MKRLFVTSESSASGNLGVSRRPDFLISLSRQLVWGQFPSDAELSGFFGKRKKRQSRPNWQDYQPQHRLEHIDAVGVALVELCSRFDVIELWMDPRTNDQLQLICLLHYLRGHPEIASRLSLVQAHVPIGGQTPEVSATWKLPAVKISKDHFELASRAWRAFGAATPQDWFGLLATDLSPLPRLRSAVATLLEELPWHRTGLGATEMRMLDFIAAWKPTPQDIGVHEARDSGGPFTMELHGDRARHRRYNKSKLAPTPLGYAILAQTDDFARHNPIRRWWGGTRLTNKQLWRWDSDNKVLVAP
jgi:hypothetical protein